MPPDPAPAARCLEKSCPVRFTAGRDRWCPEHRDDGAGTYSTHRSPWQDAGRGEPDAPQSDG